MKDAPRRHAVEYALFRGLRGAVRALPHGAARRLGAALGALGYGAMARRRRIALRNLQAAFPDATAGARRRWARESFRSLAAQALDALSLTRYDATSLCQRWSLENWHHLEAAGADGRPAILMTAHFGYWETLAHVVSLYKGDLAAITRPLDNPHLERDLSELRNRFGTTTIPKKGAARGMVRALREGRRVLLLIDQRPGREPGLEVDFFGRPARTSPLAARLAIRFELPVVPLFVHPAPGARYRIVAREPVLPVAGDDDASLSARYLAVVEREVRSDPGQWMWMHDRWRAP